MITSVMNMSSKYVFFLVLVLIVFGQSLKAQEYVVPLKSNNAIQNKGQHKQFAAKKTRATLPFVDDFSYEGPYPDDTKWEDKQAYINNVMSADQPTRGMATLDGLNQYGRPYLPFQFSSGLADSLTSTSINLSSFTTSSNVFLSFYVQPQGLGFAPEVGDSLFLYFKNSGNQWVRMWQRAGGPWQPFRIELVAVNDVQFLHADFQFRFVNIASLNLNNDTWNIDYVKLDANRSSGDSVMNDVAMTVQPTSILYPYSALPYRHFVANQANEKSSIQAFQVRNNSQNNVSVASFHQATELFSTTPISNLTLNPTTLGIYSNVNQSVPTYNVSYTAPSPTSKVIIRNKYYFNAIAGTDPKDNDTIVNDAVFDNYFAYDDGSAEKAYFLYAAFNYPAKTALEFTMTQSDTLRGLSVFFGAQAPTALGKYFSIVLYQQLAGSGLNDSIIKQDDLYQVQYDTAVNGFVNYAFSVPVALNAGKYYIGITQPANFGSDSVYYGLDVNNNTSSQHLYYNVDGNWYGSNISGSVMMRPLVGQYFTPTQIGNPAIENIGIEIFPNPVQDILMLQTSEEIETCIVIDMLGHRIKSVMPNENRILVNDLPTGNYLLECVTYKGTSKTIKFTKK